MKLNEVLKTKDIHEAVDIKSTELVKIKSLLRRDVVFAGSNVKIQVESISKIEGGIEVFIRAWDKEGNKIGFGADGSVEIERVRIINPPLLIEDQNGDIEQVLELESPNGNITTTIRRLSENHELALLESLAHTVKVIGKSGSNIKTGKIGNTTTTAYPAAGNADPVDGRISEDRYASWATTRNSTAGRVANTTTASGIALISGDYTTFYAITRAFIGFNVSAIADTDVISDATFSLYGASQNIEGSNGGFTVVSSTQSSASSLATSDFDLVGSTDFGTFVGVPAIGSYNDVTLNATGIAYISKTTRTQFAVRAYHDFTNTTPVAGVDNIFESNFYAADQSGTTQDPKLVVVHSAGGSATPLLMMMGIGT